MSGDHAAALMGLLFLPVAVIPVLLALQTMAARLLVTETLWRRIEQASPATRLGSVFVLASAAYIGAGWESVDPVGIAAKLVELAAIVVVLRSSREAPVRCWESAARARAS